MERGDGRRRGVTKNWEGRKREGGGREPERGQGEEGKRGSRYEGKRSKK